MNLISVAKVVSSFIDNKNASLEKVYKIICTEKMLPFKDILKPVDIIKVVFLTYEIINNRNPKDVEPNLSNLFTFDEIEFDNSDQEEGCETCLGDGYFTCHECDGSGNVDCTTCDGSGEDEEGNSCEDCHGGGEFVCDECGGDGSVRCPDCNGSGSVSTDQYIPYTVNSYVSYDTALETKIRSYLKNKKRTSVEFNLNNVDVQNDSTFLIFHDEVMLGEGYTSDISNEYEDKSYFLSINEKPINDSLVYVDSWGQKIANFNKIDDNISLFF